MRKGYNTNGTFVDTGLLRDHVSKLRSEKRIASQLRDSIVAMRNSSDGTAYGSYNSVLRDVNQLIDYLERMARLFDEAEGQAARISYETAREIDRNIAETLRTSSNSFML